MLGEGEMGGANGARDAEDGAASGMVEVEVSVMGIEGVDVSVSVVSLFVEVVKEENVDVVDELLKLSSTMENVDEAFDEVRSYLVVDGGNVEFVKIEGKIIVVWLNGVCGMCVLLLVMMKGGIEKFLK